MTITFTTKKIMTKIMTFTRSLARTDDDDRLMVEDDELMKEMTISITRFFVSKNHAYKNVEAQICLKFKNIVVILLVAISISFPAADEI